MRTIKTTHIDLASLNPVADRVQVHLANGWTADLRSISYDNNLQEFTLDMSGFVQKYNRSGMHRTHTHAFLNVVSMTVTVQVEEPKMPVGLWALICGRVGRCISIPIEFTRSNKEMYREDIEESFKSIKPAYTGLMCPEVFAIKEGAHLSSRSNPIPKFQEFKGE